MAARFLQKKRTRKMVCCPLFRQSVHALSVLIIIGMDEIILPVDWETNGYIDDNYMHTTM